MFHLCSHCRTPVTLRSRNREGFALRGEKRTTAAVPSAAVAAGTVISSDTAMNLACSFRILSLGFVLLLLGFGLV